MLRPKVLHIVPQLFGPGGLYGGAERYATELSRAMARRVEIRLVGFGSEPGWRRGDFGLDIVTLRNQLPARRFAGSPTAWGLWPHLQWADVIHCHQIYTMATSTALLYAHWRHKPVFATDHAGGGRCLQSYVNLDRWYSGRLWVSRFSQDQHTPQPGDRIVYGGVDCERFRPGEAGAGRSLYVGRILPVKGIERLIAALDATTPLTLLGPDYDPDFSRHLRQLARGKDVDFHPAVDGDELVRAYQSAACVILPGTELFSLAALEAMSCGKPVIGIDRGGSREAIEDGVSGFIVPAGDGAALAAKARWLCRHPEEARIMGVAARRRVEDQFSWSHVAERCFAAYGFEPSAAASPPTAATTALGASRRQSSAGGSETK